MAAVWNDKSENKGEGIMAFFDKLSETISSKSKDVAKKAKDFADVAKLNSQITTEENTINATYKEIGQACFEQYSSEAEHIFHEQFEKIRTALSHIEQLKSEIQTIKGIRLCSSCGAEMPITAGFCPSCGAKNEIPVPAAPEGEAPAMAVCPNCGTVVPDGAAFCPNCGAKSAAPAGEPAAAAAPAACPNCGAPVQEDTVFCANCGSKVK